MTKEQIEELKSRVTHQLEMVRAAPVPEELKNTMTGQTIYLRAGMATPLIVLRLLEEREKLLEALRAFIDAEDGDEHTIPGWRALENARAVVDFVEEAAP